MKTLLKTLKWIGIALLLLIIGGISYLKLGLPNIDAPQDLKVEITPERVERGRYLANHVNLCMDCHSVRDFSKFAGPITPGTFAGGGETFNEDMGFPGTFFSKNISPHGIGDWSDGELYRAITSGITKDNDVIFPVMPWPNYSKMASEDVYSIIAYIRSLDPITTENKPSEAVFPVNLIKNTFPMPADPQPIPDKSDLVAYGGYLTNAAGCIECHTKKDDKGNNIAGTEFGGGMSFKLPGIGTVYSANLTPDPTTGLKYSKEDFIKLFKAYADSSYVPHEIKKGDFQTLMPWIMYAGMTEEDLGAIYSYLKTLKPIKNDVVKFEPDDLALN
ncbi:MAG: cytochrome c [Cytophagales bacterium]|nr:cytochrome c [Cytophagales bacterium]